MKQLFFSIVLLIGISTTFAQNFADKEYYLIDSLVLANLSEFDSILIEKQLKKYHTESTFHKLECLNSIIELSSDDFLWKAYNKPFLEQSGQYLNNFEEETEDWKTVSYFYTLAIHTKALMFDYEEELDSALFYYEIAIELLKKLDLNQEVGETMSSIAGIYLDTDRFYESIELANQSLKYLDTNNINTAICLSNYGNFQLVQGNFEEAIYFNNEAFKIAKRFENSKHVIIALSNIANIKRRENKIEEADSILQYTIPKMDSIENLRPYDYLYVIVELGQVLLEQNKIDSAQIVFENMLKIAEENDFKYQILEASSALSKIFFLKEDYKISKKYAIASYTLAHEFTIYDGISSSLKRLIPIAEQEQNFKQAFKYQKEYQILVDEMKNEEKLKATLKQSVQFQFDKQKEIDDLKNSQEIEIIQQQKQKTRLGLIAAGIITILIGVFSIFILNKLKLIRSQKTKLDDAYLKLEESTKNELAVSNLKALKSQMNPHFIFNLLNSIQALVLKGDIDASYNYMTKFATLVRQTLHFSDSDLVELDEETNLLKIYLDLEKLRFSKDFEYEIEDNDIEGIEIPPLLIQPFIENALVHGLMHKEGKKTLKVAFKIKDKLICTITDNGIGRVKSKAIKERQNAQHQSFSTRAIKKRFKILSETYKGEFGFNYEDIIEGDKLIATQVKLHIPFKRAF